MPDLSSRSKELASFYSFSSLKSKLNCQVLTGKGILPFSSERVRPNWIILVESIFFLTYMY